MPVISDHLDLENVPCGTDHFPNPNPNPNPNPCGSDHFNDMRIIFDLTFCGDWDGGVFAGDCAAEIAANG
jgi:hypothetical protein